MEAPSPDFSAIITALLDGRVAELQAFFNPRPTAGLLDLDRLALDVCDPDSCYAKGQDRSRYGAASRYLCR